MRADTERQYGFGEHTPSVKIWRCQKCGWIRPVLTQGDLDAWQTAKPYEAPTENKNNLEYDMEQINGEPRGQPGHPAKQHKCSCSGGCSCGSGSKKTCGGGCSGCG